MKRSTSIILTIISISISIHLPKAWAADPADQAKCDRACGGGKYQYSEGTVYIFEGQKICGCKNQTSGKSGALGDKGLYYKMSDDKSKIGTKNKTGNWKDDGGNAPEYLGKESDRISSKEFEEIKKNSTPPKKEEVPPKKEDVPPKKEDVPPKKEDVPPKKEDVPPKKEDVPPKKEDVPPPPETAPKSKSTWESANGKLACSTAAFFAVQAGMRIYSIVNITVTENDICKNIKNYAGNAPTPDAGASPSSASTSTSSSSSTGGGSNPDLDMAGFASKNGVGGNQNNAKNSVGQAHSSDYGLSVPAQAYMAVDGSTLMKTGLDKMAAVSAAPLKAHDPRDAARRGAGALIREITAGKLGALGEGLAQIGDKAQHDGDLLGAALSGRGGAVSGASGASGSQYSSQYSGVGSVGMGAGAAAPAAALGANSGAAAAAPSTSGGFFGSLFGGGGGSTGDTARTPATASILQYDPATDIWHTTSKGTIFDIVTTKMRVVGPRVQ